MTWIVPADKEAEVDAFWQDHETWMRETHQIGIVFPKDDKKPRLLTYYISKGQQPNDPMNPEAGTTGSIIYQMTETYVDESDLQKHMAAASSWEPFKDGTMTKYMTEYGIHTTLGHDKVWMTMAD